MPSEARGSSISARPPFRATFAVPEGFALTDSFKMSPERGLAQVEVLRDPATSSVWLTTDWVSRDSYELHRDWLARELGFQATPQTAGFLAEIRCPRKPWWRRLPLYGLAMGALGFLGSLELARSRYGLFFGPADVEVRVGETNEIRAAEGAPTVVSVSATNHSRVVTAVLRHIEADIFPSGATDAEPATEVMIAGKLGPLAPGGESAADLRLGALPEAGDYTLRVRYALSGGLFRAAERTEVEVPVKVWPELEVGRPELEAGGQRSRDVPRHVWARLALRSGARFDTGLDCFAELLRVPGLSFTGLTSASIGLEETGRGTVDRSGSEVTYVQWRTSAVGPFEASHLLIGIRSDRPRADWQRIVTALDVRCFRRGDQP